MRDRHAPSNPLGLEPELRPFVPGDHPAAMALWQGTPGVGLSAADEAGPIARYLARNPGTSFVATEGAALVGTILAGHDGRRGLIHHLAVATPCRRRGLGRALVRASLAALADAGIDKCHLMVFRDNAAGLAFWRGVQGTERIELTLFSLATPPAPGAPA